MTPKKATLTEALGKARPRHTFTNDKGEDLTVTLLPVSLVEVAEFEEWQEKEGTKPREMLAMMLQLLNEREPSGDVRAWLRRVGMEDMGAILSTVLSGKAPDPNA